MSEAKAVGEKQRWSGLLSAAAIAIMLIPLLLLALDLASRFTERIEPDQLTLIYPDGRSSVRNIPPNWLVEQTVEGPIQLEMSFPKCLRVDRYRFWVGSDGLDSTMRQPSAWTLWVNNGGNDWTQADSRTVSRNYLNGWWYAYPLKAESDCVERVRIDVEKLSGSNILRLYKFQLYQSWYPERMASAWVASSGLLAASLYHASAISTALLQIPGVQTAFNTTTLAILAAALALQLLWRGWERSALNRLIFHRNASANRDIACALLLGLGYVGIFGTVYSLGGNKLTEMLSHRIIGWLNPFGLQLNSGLLVLDIAIYLLVVTFFDYWGHRALHTKPFWPLHRFHHSATEFNSLTVYRNHPALVAWDPLFKMWPVALLPMTPSLAAYWPQVGLLWLVIQVTNHSDFDWTYGWIGRWVLMSPGMHKIHHSTDPAHFEKNLGNLFIFWDRIFGTYHDASPEPVALGLSGEDGKLSEHWTVVEWALDIKHLVTGKYAKPADTRYGAEPASLQNHGVAEFCAGGALQGPAVPARLDL